MSLGWAADARIGDRFIECVPNFSEGRRPEVISAIVAAVEEVPGVHILDVDSDPDHNRFVLTYVVPPDAAVASGLAGARAALQHIDLHTHQGVHPRIGALDVFPFVPLGDAPMEQCVLLARDLGRRIADELRIPVYLYGEAAQRPGRTNLEEIRRGGLAALETMAADPERWPDYGPVALHPTAGACVVGARRPLIAFNVYLNTGDVLVARAIARAVRHSSGVLRDVKALGLQLPGSGAVQVSMNLTNFHGTSLVQVMDLIGADAARWGVSVTHTEVVGLVPVDALLDAAEAFLQLHGFSRQKILERRLATAPAT
jgi:glutamate formiminotransferase